VFLVSGAHFVHDVFTSFIAPLLPLLIRKFGLSLLEAGSLSVYTQLPSVLSPVLGSFADRGHFHRLLVILGPGVSGVALCLMGVAPGYAALTVLLLTAGCSIAGLHVAGPVLVSQVAGTRVGWAMSLFMAGGELARTVGPMMAVQAVAFFGLDGLWKLIPVALASSLLLWWRLSAATAVASPERPSRLLVVWLRMRRVLIAVSGILLARAFLVGGLTVFLPTFIEGEGDGLFMAGVSLSVFEAGGVAGALIAGTLSDLIGRRRVLLGIVLLSPPLMLIFLATSGPLRLLVLAALGFVALSTTPVLLAVTIQNAEANRAAANGTYMMVSFAARALIVLAVGMMGDAIGLRAAYVWCAALAMLGLPFVLMLPSGKHGSGNGCTHERL
jgi:FSR family fosmidomycin resistance protein-like MFS transporter